MLHTRLATVVFLLSATAASAAPITINFDGTFNLGATTVFGKTGSTPFHFTLTYDPALDTNTSFIATGDPTDAPAVAGHNMYGYSTSGIVGLTFTFGTQTWTSGDLVDLSIGAQSAPIWFDTDIATATPTLAHLLFSAPQGSLVMPRTNAGGTTAFTGQTSVFENGGNSSTAFTTISRASATPVSEPGTLVLLAAGLGAAARRFRRRRD